MQVSVLASVRRASAVVAEGENDCRANVPLEMNEIAPIRLRFASQISAPVRARIAYAFRVFAAIYGYRVVDESSHEPAALVVYGESTAGSDAGCIAIPARYVMDSDGSSAARVTKHCYAGEEFPLAFGLDPQTREPDWLGEIFLWLSGSYEKGITSRDSVGRVPYQETIFAKHGISPRKPYAALLMAWLESALRNKNGAETLCKAPSPINNADHLVVSSHDIDFYYTNWGSTFFRLLKNLGISFRIYRSWSFFQSNSVMILELLGGKRVGDYLPALLNAIRQSDFNSTFFVVTSHSHRRDPNYRLNDLSDALVDAQRKGSSVCVHGSYTSVLDRGNLTPEVSTLGKTLGSEPLGGRQHWLRFDNQEQLFGIVQNAKLLFDSSVGFSEVVGYRSGASFAFPPYNFHEEKPHEFLEIPLAIMDGSLESDSRLHGGDPQAIADEVLAESRKVGWGGLSVLWHNPVEPLAVPEEINRVYWNCAKTRSQHNEKWMSAGELLQCSLSRYRNAGLLQGARVDA